MKSPLMIWANEIKNQMTGKGESVTSTSLTARMVAEDSREVRNWFFNRIPPGNMDIDKVEDRIEVLRFVATRLVVN